MSKPSGLTDRFGNPLSSQASTESTQKVPEDVQLPEVNFTNHIISLMTSATHYCGIQTHPEQKKIPKHKGLARYHIDTIQMLHDKCKANLDPQETRFIEEVLLELKRMFVQAFGDTHEKNV